MSQDSNKGWVCPKCDAAVAPTVTTCPKCGKQKVDEANRDERDVLLG
jgi:ribosomal protein L40E